jgi:hypothetical protein
VKAIHSYTAAKPDELSFAAGDIMTVTKKDPTGWWDAVHNGNGKKGLIPHTFVEDYTSVPVSAPAPVSRPLPVPKPIVKADPPSSSSSPGC